LLIEDGCAKVDAWRLKTKTGERPWMRLAFVLLRPLRSIDSDTSSPGPRRPIIPLALKAENYLLSTSFTLDASQSRGRDANCHGTSD
jgi:hypothetical protein